MLSRARRFKSDRLWNSLRSLSCSGLSSFVVELRYLRTQGGQRHFLLVCLLLSPAFPKCGAWSCGTEMPPLLVKSVGLQLWPVYNTFSFPASFYFLQASSSRDELSFLGPSRCMLCALKNFRCHEGTVTHRSRVAFPIPVCLWHSYGPHQSPQQTELLPIPFAPTRLRFTCPLLFRDLASWPS